MPLKRQLGTEARDDEAEPVRDAAAEEERGLPSDHQRAPDETVAVVEEAGADSPAPEGRRRWAFLRRWTRRAPEPTVVGDSVAEKDSETTEPATDAANPDADPAPRTPVGKAGRAPKTVAAPVAETSAAAAPVEVDAADVPPVDETPTGAESLDAAPEAAFVATGDVADPESDAAPSEPQDDANETEDASPALVAHRPAGTRLQIAMVAAAALFVAGAAFAGAMVQPYLADRAAVDTKVDVARTAAEAITTLWSYTPDDMDTLADRASGFLGGDFATEYRRYIDAIVETNKQAQVTNKTQVMGTAVESLNPTGATAIVYTNSVSTSPVSKNIPSLRYLSYRLTLEREDAKWLITGMNAVTQLDLTPQL